MIDCIMQSIIFKELDYRTHRDEYTRKVKPTQDAVGEKTRISEIIFDFGFLICKTNILFLQLTPWLNNSYEYKKFFIVILSRYLSVSFALSG
ncbi:MAG TPA: hypothetical protein VFY68_00200 [Nitrososphaeraceae archaeon]|nr:hypothetical protein [Nitrososphaeraceae archaeon]